MAGIKTSPATIKLFTVLFLILTISSPSPKFVNAFTFPFSFTQYKTLISISRSLLLRVANLRASRGDALGSSRVRAMADEIDRGLGLGFISRAWSVGWDYMWNYAWRKGGIDYGEMYGAIGDLNELMGLVTEFNRAESNADKASSVARSYGKALRVSNKLLRRLLRIFAKSGALREFWEMVQAEVVDGELLQDCLEVGGNDVKSLLQIAKDMAVQFFSSQSRSSDEL
ncbi:hypothetical protein AtNW77_Chr5g0129381 [Arabidopsis thaliana]|uniref:Adenine phosphoribosyltransferase n=4 Tax=Arabidopsis TaxID=3701 RepID=Q0WPS6_ARATH|nr:adenine phosphoribosyltransferase [Arabidopsis thaliana]KAG7605047.1 hypothetical protein ISN45_At05g040720 [Arabidopsis thaliana x Arabidopsis arenosa]KAG7612033.1 hypothetical protein ISN44_As05g040940 [Arabidopsis suecica]AED95281.1 adenine phosphoribosyltransferase [Arabidopsis thaliana]OAO96443.1 hypothetical protein AXX17_AT5G44050 [Arabidopsis thaliana]CAA0407811.1 unnamed protein product [Arabidopsis thaliana]|eukprot:NP_974890.1 adenine phosphoribosyltransferase [Arabidopsis thaliana]